MNFTEQDPALSVCFTGHRRIPLNEMADVTSMLEKKILELSLEGYQNFFVGGALGFDTLAAIALSRVIEQGRVQIRPILCLPCSEQTKLWNESEKRAYELLMPSYEKLVQIYDNYNSACMHLRNRFMVDHSSYCVAYMMHNGGGTASTVQYALKKGLKVFNAATMEQIN